MISKVDIDTFKENDRGKVAVNDQGSTGNSSNQSSETLKLEDGDDYRDAIVHQRV